MIIKSIDQGDWPKDVHRNSIQFINKIVTAFDGFWRFMQRLKSMKAELVSSEEFPLSAAVAQEMM